MWKNLNPCLIDCPLKGWVAILEFEEYHVCLFWRLLKLFQLSATSGGECFFLNSDGISQIPGATAVTSLFTVRYPCPLLVANPLSQEMLAVGQTWTGYKIILVFVSSERNTSTFKSTKWLNCWGLYMPWTNTEIRTIIQIN